MYSESLAKLMVELGKLPGIGPKGAQRIAFHVLRSNSDEVSELAEALLQVKARVRFCEICGNLSEQTECVICQNPNRSNSEVCVVEEAKDVSAIERTGEFRGRYHVLGGVIDPIANIGPGDLNVAALLRRLADGEVTEVILATNPNVPGEATASYLARLIAPLGVTVSRLASGLPVGGDLEYADEITLGRAFSSRRTVS